MRAAPLLVILVTMLATFAGCVSAGSKTAAPGVTGPGAQSGPAQFNETTGAVEGIVTDPELAPVVGALVGLTPTADAPAVQTTSDAQGHFALSNVAPGKRSLAVSALGFVATSMMVEVVAGQAKQLTIALDMMPSQEPYHITQIKKIVITGNAERYYPSCTSFATILPPTGVQQIDQYRTLIKTCQGGGGADKIPYWTNETAKALDPVTLIAELQWTPTNAGLGRGVDMEFIAPNITRGSGGSIDQTDKHDWEKFQGQSPMIFRVDIPTTLEDRKIPESDWYSFPNNDCTAPTPSKTSSPNCSWFARLWVAPCDIGANIGGCFASPVDFGEADLTPITVTLYFSAFYKEPAEPTFSALPDA